MKAMPMKIEHIAIWAEDIELMRTFYQSYFGMQSSGKYENPAKKFSSYFLSFGEGSARMELMHRPGIADAGGKRGALKGLAHLAISVGSEANVDRLTERLRADNYTIEAEPRRTGDGYYESVVLDPEGNCVEITA